MPRPYRCVYRGARVGLVTSGGYGYRLNRSIALGLRAHGSGAPGMELEVEILGERRRAVVGARAALRSGEPAPAQLIERCRLQPGQTVSPYSTLDLR